MADSSRKLSRIAQVFGVCILFCQSVSWSSAQAPTTPLAPGQEVAWSADNVPNQPGIVRSGKSVIGPDGTIAVGPYGYCKIVGQTPLQAAESLELHLKPYLKTPKIHVAATPLANSELVVWRTVRDTPIVRGASGEVIVTVPQDATPFSVGKSVKEPTAVRTTAPQKSGFVKGTFVKMGGTQTVEPPNSTVIQEVGPAPAVMSGHGPGQEMVVVKAMPSFNEMPTGIYPAAPSELNRVLLPSYVIGPPDVLQIDSLKGLVNQPIKGPHLVRPDGTVGLGSYGSAVVAGLTLDQAKDAVARVIHARLDPKVVTLKDVVEGLTVDVLAYNSKVYYVITDGGGFGEQVTRMPVTGNETVLDAISQINGLPAVASKKNIWIARRTPGQGGPESILKVDWIGITQRGSAATNYQMMPGDRLYVQADHWRTADAVVAKVLAPFERVLGITLLGSQTVNSIRSGSTTSGR